VTHDRNPRPAVTASGGAMPDLVLMSNHRRFLLAVLLFASIPAGAQQIVAVAQPDVRRIGAGSLRAAGSFQFVLEAPPETIARAFLLYELTGVPRWTAAVRSINGLPELGGFDAVLSAGSTMQIEEINPRWLREGTNEVRFYPAVMRGGAPPSRVVDLRQRHGGLSLAVPDLDVPYTVRNLRLLYLEGTASKPALHLTYPAGGELRDDGTILCGYVDPALLAGGAAELFVNDAYLPHGIDPADGTFAVYVPRTGAAGEAWEVRVEVVYPDGTRLRQNVRLAM
jgi:hypothetical protein